MKWLFGHNGLIWCVYASYKYVHPVGIKDHFDFIVELPFAVYRYMRLRAKG